MKDTIIYEQPLNEIMRVCLRLEHLFHQIDHQLHDNSISATRNVVAFIINLLQIADRPDLKSKLAKEMSFHLSNLLRYGNNPEIDSDKLKNLTQQLEELSRNLIDNSGKIGYRLRDMELLNTLRLHLTTPGGGCAFDTPLFHYWLQQPREYHEKTILSWLNDFQQIRTAISLVLDLVRKNAKIEKKEAVHGFHQEMLDPQSNLRMIRIGVDPLASAFPEISVGRHFLSARFFSPDIEKRPTQYTGNLPFWMGYCIL